MMYMPTIARATPADPRVVWQFYIDTVKVRKLDSGVVQVASDDQGWPVDATWDRDAAFEGALARIERVSDEMKRDVDTNE